MIGRFHYKSTLFKEYCLHQFVECINKQVLSLEIQRLQAEVERFNAVQAIQWCSIERLASLFQSTNS